MRGEQPGHKWTSPPLACSLIARVHNMFNTRNHQRWSRFHSMEDQVVMTHAKQTNDKPRNEDFLRLAEQQQSCFLPFQCAYLSHIHFDFTSTRASPASRDSWSHMHVGVALPKQMRQLTYTDPSPSALMHPRGSAGVARGTTPGFSQIAIPGLLSSTGVALPFDLLPFSYQDRTNTISTRWEMFSDDRPALKNTEHTHANRNTRRVRAHTAGLV